MAAKEWSYGYEDLMRATGLSRTAIVKHCTSGYFVPEDIASVAIYLSRYASEEVKRKMIENIVWRQLPKDPGGWKKKRAAAKGKE
jgi:hypothetical protein